MHGGGFKLGQLRQARALGGLAQGFQGDQQLHGFCTLSCAEVAVARGQCQAVFCTLGFTGDDLYRQSQLLHHALHHQHLLVVFFAESSDTLGHTGKNTGKKFEHHGADTNEKAGPKMPFKNVRQLRGRVNLVGLRLWVELFFARSKQQVAAGRLQALGIGVQRAGVAVKVFVRRELKAVDKNAGDRHVAQCPGLFDQCDMAVVQITHGGHKGGSLETAQLLAQVGNGVNNLHQKNPCGRICERMTGTDYKKIRPVYRPVARKSVQRLQPVSHRSDLPCTTPAWQ